MTLRNFIVFEGIDGSGTTTQASILKERLGERLFLTAEPTKGVIGRFLRRILSGEEAVCQEALAYLFAADRAEHLCEIKKEAANRLVLSDRYLFSSLVYQGALDCASLSPTAALETSASDTSADLVRLINSPFPLPEMVFYFRIGGEDAFQRVEKRGGQREIFEKRQTLIRLSQKYDEVMHRFASAESGCKIKTIDAAKDKETIAREIALSLPQ